MISCLDQNDKKLWTKSEISFQIYNTELLKWTFILA